MNSNGKSAPFDVLVLRQAVARQGLLHVAPGLTKPHLAHHPVRKTEFAVRARTEAQVVAKLPVIEVVKAAVAGRGIGRHFVALQASGTGQVGDEVQHVVSGIVLRQRRRVLGKEGIGLDGELIN